MAIAAIDADPARAASTETGSGAYGETVDPFAMDGGHGHLAMGRCFAGLEADQAPMIR